MHCLYGLVRFRKPMTTAAERITKYLDERTKMRGLDQSDIHGFNVGHESREAHLTADDLREVLRENKRMESALEHIEKMPWPNSEAPYARTARSALPLANTQDQTRSGEKE